MEGIRSAARRHPLVAFYAFTLAYSWGLWALMIASARGLLPFPFVTNWTGSFGPAFGALVTAALIGGRAAVGDLLRPIGRWRFGWRLWLLLGLGSMLPFFAGVGAYAALHGTGGGVDGLMGQLPALLYYWPIVFVIGGPLGEEIGWRGFALPRLLDRHSPAVASLLLATAWLLWHLPLFWMEGAAQKGGSIALFAAAVAVFSFLFTWAYRKSGGSLLAVLLLHTGINAPSLLVPEGAAFADSVLTESVTMGLWVAAAAAVLLLGRREFFRKPASTPA